MKKNTTGKNPEDIAIAPIEALGEDATPIELDATAPDPEDAAPTGEKTSASGRQWLKYAGIGPGRNITPARSAQPAGGLTGEAITSLGSLEAEVMAAVWDLNGPVTGMEVMEHSLYKRRSQGEEPASFATIATTLRRLTQKGLLVTKKNAQRTPVYLPTVGREEMAARVLNNVSQTLLGRSLYALLPRLTGGRPTPSLIQPEIAPAKQKISPKAGVSSISGVPSADDIAVGHLLQALEALADAEGQDETKTTEDGTKTT